jgi:hypothetical protein
MTKRPKNSVMIVAALLAAVATVAVTAAMASSNGRATKASTPPAHVSARLATIFRVLQRAHRASSVDAKPLPTAALQGLSVQAGMDPSSAVFAGGTYPTWVVPGSTEVCLMHDALTSRDAPGGICGSVKAAEHGLAEATESATGAPLILGLVPNGNASVTVTNANGTTDSVPVSDNVYEITSGVPASVTLKTASGTAETRHLPTLSPPPPSSAPAAPVP